MKTLLHYLTILPCAFLLVFVSSSVLAQLEVVWEQQVGSNRIEYPSGLERLSSGEYMAMVLGYDLNYNYLTRVFIYSEEGEELVYRTVNVGDDPYNPVQPWPGYIAMVLGWSFQLEFTTLGLVSLQGDVVWETTVAGFRRELIPTSDSCFVSADNIYNEISGSDVIVTKISSTGEILWETLYDIPESQYAYAFTSTVSNITVVGCVNSTQEISYNRVFALFIDPNGVIYQSITLSEREILNTISINDISVEADGNIMFTGKFEVDGQACSVIRLSPDGEVLNTGGEPPNYHVLMPDGSLLLYEKGSEGGLDSRSYFHHYDMSLNELWLDWYSYPPAVNYPSPYIQDVEVNNVGEFLVQGCYFYGLGAYPPPNVFLTKFETVQQPLSIFVQPQDTIVVYDRPRNLFYGARLSNSTDEPIQTDVWIIARGANGYPSGPIRMWEEVTIPANGSFEGVLRQFVPAGIARGQYNYIVRIGDYPNPTVQDYFIFTVIDGPEPDINPPRERGVVAAFLPAPEWETHPARFEPSTASQKILEAALGED
jgi:hypothetical protein